MNLALLIISSLFFLIIARLSYEIWFFPIKYKSRLTGHRKLIKLIIGFSFWNENHINWKIVKIASIIMLMISILGIVVSITGPFSY